MKTRFQKLVMFPEISNLVLIIECFYWGIINLSSVHLQNISSWNQLSRTNIVKKPRSGNGIHRKRWLVRDL